MSSKITFSYDSNDKKVIVPLDAEDGYTLDELTAYFIDFCCSIGYSAESFNNFLNEITYFNDANDWAAEVICDREMKNL